MTVQEAISVRKSIRSYTGEPVSQEELQALLKAAEESPVGMAKYNTLRLTVISNKELLDEIDRNAAVFFGNPDMHPLYGAPTLIVVSSSEQDNVGSANVAMIVHNMALTAVSLGVGHVDIYGAIRGLITNKDLLAKLNLPGGFVPLGAIAVGKSDDSYQPRSIDLNRIETAYI